MEIERDLLAILRRSEDREFERCVSRGETNLRFIKLGSAGDGELVRLEPDFPGEAKGKLLRERTFRVGGTGGPWQQRSCQHIGHRQ